LCVCEGASKKNTQHPNQELHVFSEEATATCKNKKKSMTTREKDPNRGRINPKEARRSFGWELLDVFLFRRVCAVKSLFLPANAMVATPTTAQYYKATATENKMIKMRCRFFFLRGVLSAPLVFVCVLFFDGGGVDKSREFGTASYAVRHFFLFFSLASSFSSLNHFVVTV